MVLEEVELATVSWILKDNNKPTIKPQSNKLGKICSSSFGKGKQPT